MLAADMKVAVTKATHPAVLLGEPDAGDREVYGAWLEDAGMGRPVVVIADKYRKDRSFRPELVFVLGSNPGAESLLLGIRSMPKEAQRW